MNLKRFVGGLNEKRLVKMKPMKKKLLICLITMSFILVAGCSRVTPKPIKPGDTVQLTYTCRNQNGEVVSTVDEKTGRNTPSSELTVFVPPLSYGPVSLIAQENASSQIQGPFIDFEDLIRAKLAEKVIHLKKDQEEQVTFSVPTDEEKDPGDRYLSMARKLKRDKEKIISLSRFPKSPEEQPMPGMEFMIEPGFKARVSRIEKGQVYLAVIPANGNIYDTFMGKAKIIEEANHYNVEIMPKKGATVRIGKLLGNITEVTDELVKMDFGNPLGNQTLTCDVKIEEIVESGSPSDQFTKQEVMEKINNAISDAEAKGQTTININLGEDPKKVQNGDLVKADFTVSDEKGEVWYTTREKDARLIQKDSPAFKNDTGKQLVLTPSQFVVGLDDPVAGLQQAVSDMEMGQRKIVTIPPEKAYGNVDPLKIKQFPCIQTSSRQTKMSSGEFIKMTGLPPVLHEKVTLNPYLEAEISELNGDEVILTAIAEDGKVIEDKLGKTSIHIKGDTVYLTLTPEIGAEFPMNDRIGRVVNTDGIQFTVDFNHPLAGKTLTVDINLVELTKASTIMSKELPWQPDYGFALDMATQEHKPMVLILYASWCGWSQKLLHEVLNDPRIKMIQDQFVWMKIDSDQDKAFYQEFKQESFPTIVLMNPEGEIINKLQGFQPADTLRGELIKCLGNQTDLISHL
ncbi:MAG: thioredoxin family protein [Proteobacteria bacterium]|nr:thioredoxin family protein [Pseudomonadota bacterium]